MKKEFFNDEFIKTVTSDGWEVLDSGETRNIDYNKRCLVIAKTQKIAEILKTPASKTSKKPVESRDLGIPPKNRYGKFKGLGWVFFFCCSHLF